MLKTNLDYSYLVHFWLSLLIVATTFTKLRFFGAFGAHDILFVITLIALTTYRQNKTLLFYIFLFIFVTLITLFINFILNNPIAHSFTHDLLALLLNGLFLSVLINNHRIAITKLFYSLYFVISLYLIFIFIFGVVLEKNYFWWLFDIENSRLSGLAINPNQTSFVVLLLTGLSLYFFLNTKPLFKKILHALLVLFSLLLATYVDADALYMAIAAFIAMTIFLYSPTPLKIFELTLFVSIMIYISLNIEIIDNYISAFQAQERFARWLSFEGLFPQALVIGFGLGGHGPSFDDTYKLATGLPFQNTEFHNIFLDFFSQFGILFGFIMICIYLFNLIKICKRSLYLFIALTAGLFVMSFFHMYLRHPLFWFIALLPFIYQYKENKKCAE